MNVFSSSLAFHFLIVGVEIMICDFYSNEHLFVFVFSTQDNFESYLSVASTVPSVLCLILNYFLVNRLLPHSVFYHMMCLFGLTSRNTDSDIMIKSVFIKLQITFLMFCRQVVPRRQNPLVSFCDLLGVPADHGVREGGLVRAQYRVLHRDSCQRGRHQRRLQHLLRQRVRDQRLLSHEDLSGAYIR